MMEGMEHQAADLREKFNNLADWAALRTHNMALALAYKPTDDWQAIRARLRAEAMRENRAAYRAEIRRMRAMRNGTGPIDNRPNVNSSP